MKFTDEQFEKLLEYVDRSMKIEEERHKQRQRNFEAALQEWHQAFDAGDMRRVAAAQRILDTYPDFKYSPMPHLTYRSSINTHMFDYTRFESDDEGEGGEEG